MYVFHVSVLGVVLSVVALMIIGSLWYSPLLFGKMWARLVGMPTDMTKEMKRKANISMALMIIPALIESYVLSIFLKNMFVPTWQAAFHIALFVWVGFVATTMASDHLFNAKHKPWKLYFINAGYQLVALLVISCILFRFNM